MITRRWEGETAVIVASGPSATRDDVELTKGVGKTITVNDSWQLCPWADILYAADRRWWQHHEYVEQFVGERWTQDKGHKTWSVEAVENGLRVVKSVHNTTSFSFDPSLIHTGLNSGFQAINIAVLKGVKKILLLGFDYSTHSGKSHWFGDHPGKLNKKSPYPLFKEAMHNAAPGLIQHGVEVINCSVNSSITCFEKMRVSDAI